MTNIEIARVVHAANREMQRLSGGIAVPVAPAWEHESVEVQTALIDAVFTQRHDPATSAEDSHNRWCAAKRGAGWVYGPRKDELRREHPNLVPFADLPTTEQCKDKLFIAIVAALS